MADKATEVPAGIPAGVAPEFFGMSPEAAKEYILRVKTQIKLTERQIASIKEEITKWEGRITLAESKGAGDLKEAAEAESAKARKKLHALETENGEYRAEAEKLLRSLPGIAARQRSIDPDLLEQELNILLGRSPSL
jgi:chromosome segregation ATPase